MGPRPGPALRASAPSFRDAVVVVVEKTFAMRHSREKSREEERMKTFGKTATR